MESGRRRILESANLKSVLDSQAVRAAFGGWTNLAGEEHADRIDRIFVYGAAGFEHLSLPDIFSILDQRTDTGMNRSR